MRERRDRQERRDKQKTPRQTTNTNTIKCPAACNKCSVCEGRLDIRRNMCEKRALKFTRFRAVFTNSRDSESALITTKIHGVYCFVRSADKSASPHTPTHPPRVRAKSKKARVYSSITYLMSFRCRHIPATSSPYPTTNLSGILNPQ